MCDQDQEQFNFEGDVAVLSTTTSHKVTIVGASYSDEEQFRVIYYSHTDLPVPEFPTKNCTAIYRGFFTETEPRCVKAYSTSSFIRLSKTIFTTARQVRNKNSGRLPLINNNKCSYLPRHKEMEEFEKFPWIKLRSYPLHEDVYDWPSEMDPFDPERKVSTGGDIVFFKAQTDYSPSVRIAIPRPNLPIIGEECFLIGYPVKKNQEDMQSWISKVYVNTDSGRITPVVMEITQNANKEDMLHFLMEDIKKEIASCIEEFFPPATRVTTVGKVLAYKDGILAVGASSFPGMSGGACLDKNGKLLGSVIGSVLGANYNLVLGVHHPAFKKQYLKQVLPTLDTKEIELVQEYLTEINQ